MGKTIKEQKQERAYQIAQIAAVIGGTRLQDVGDASKRFIQEVVTNATSLLEEAENRVAERGEFR